MIRLAIITIYDNNNIGNRLQNYAMQEFLEFNFDCKSVTIKNLTYKSSMSRSIKELLEKTYSRFKSNIVKRKIKSFILFSENINYTSEILYTGDNLDKFKNKYDKFIIGSDQIWNYDFREKYFGNFEFGLFADSSKCISYSASIGINDIPNDKKEIYKYGLNHLKYISVRENRAKEIVEELTGRTDVEVLVDPTMLLTPKEWDRVSKKPKQLNFDNYILNYFLGELSELRRKEIERIAKENNCKIINILDQNDPFYVCGPSEFLYLEKHAFLICTDSFHSSVFAILYDRPFIVFDREDNVVKMNSRIDTLLDKFNLKNRRYNGKITNENLEHDYKDAYKILEEERKKSFKFLEDALKN